MAKVKYLIASCLFIVLAACAESERHYVITGDLSATYSNGDIVIWSPEPKKAASAAAPAASMGAAPAAKSSGMSAAKPAKSSGAVSMGGAMSMSAASSSNKSLRDSLNILAEAKLENGKFRIEGEVDGVEVVYFYVLGAVSKDGRTLAPSKGQGFLLEPGELTMIMGDRNKFTITGGKYNDAVYNSWKLSDEYKTAVADMYRLYREVPGESETEKRARLDKAAAAQNHMLDVETQGRKKVALEHPDVLARKLAIQTAWLGGRWMLDAAYGIQKITPDDPWVNEYIARQEDFYAKRAKNKAISSVGSDIRDFDTHTLAGEMVSLKEVRGKNKYVLLEFWASWCGPCRAEIPHMKKAYAKYHDKGFEIFSFTIDDDKGRMGYCFQRRANSLDRYRIWQRQRTQKAL